MHLSIAIRRSVAIISVLTSTLVPAARARAADQGATADPAPWPAASSPKAMMDAKTEAMAAALLLQMTVEVGQVIQADLTSIKPEDLKTCWTHRDACYLVLREVRLSSNEGDAVCPGD